MHFNFYLHYPSRLKFHNIPIYTDYHWNDTTQCLIIHYLTSVNTRDWNFSKLLVSLCKNVLHVWTYGSYTIYMSWTIHSVFVPFQFNYFPRIKCTQVSYIIWNYGNNITPNFQILRCLHMSKVKFTLTYITNDKEDYDEYTNFPSEKNQGHFLINQNRNW